MPIAKFRIGVIDVGAASGVVEHVSVELSNPRLASRRGGDIRPFPPIGEELTSEQGAAVNEGGFVRTHPPNRSAKGVRRGFVTSWAVFGATAGTMLGGASAQRCREPCRPRLSYLGGGVRPLAASLTVTLTMPEPSPDLSILPTREWSAERPRFTRVAVAAWNYSSGLNVGASPSSNPVRSTAVSIADI